MNKYITSSGLFKKLRTTELIYETFDTQILDTRPLKNVGMTTQSSDFPVIFSLSTICPIAFRQQFLSYFTSSN